MHILSESFHFLTFLSKIMHFWGSPGGYGVGRGSKRGSVSLCFYRHARSWIW